MAGGVAMAAAVAIAGAQAPPPSRPAPQAASPLVLSARAEAELKIEQAIGHLYQLLLEQPGTPQAIQARLRLARLLALSGSDQAALAQCQRIREDVPSDSPYQTRALELATIVSRRVRVSSGFPLLPVFEAVVSRGIQSLDNPRTIEFESESRFLLFDEGGSGRLYRVAPDATSQLPVPRDMSAVSLLPGGGILMAGKDNLVAVSPARTFTLTGSWGGRTRQLKEIKSIASTSTGDLLVVDGDFDGLLRCPAGGTSCAPWGVSTKLREVVVGAGDWVYALDDKGKIVRVFDSTQKSLAVVGPSVGSMSLDKVENIAVDQSDGLYLLDKDLKRLFVVVMRADATGRIAPTSLGSVPLPQDGPMAVKNPSALGVAPSGAVYVAGRSSARVMRFQ
ncbi:MAG: hypothetical protein AB1806_09105 [Acidobacteriota bacterium]